MDNHRDKIIINKDGTIDDYANNTKLNFAPVGTKLQIKSDLKLKIINGSKHINTDSDVMSGMYFACESIWHITRRFFVFGKSIEIRDFNLSLYESMNNKKGIFIDFLDEWEGEFERAGLQDASLNISIELPKDVWYRIFAQNMSDDCDYYITLHRLLDGKYGFYGNNSYYKFFDYGTVIENKSHKISKDTLHELKEVHNGQAELDFDVEFTIQKKAKQNTSEPKKSFWR